ncbi:MAG: glutamine--fructose-6-phosphate transaminase (isomerizing) [Gammaproteobacteria bacterium]|nr:MAG: glutamine--fructose-6-phosphate transaminase (isomerizing) [Gammaproteobacteria bacterium]
MCGIVGAVAERQVTPILIEGLKRLEYRGYDSSGIAVIDPETGSLKRLRRLGKVNELVKANQEQGTEGTVGIAHTRWATHGRPSEANAHPHLSGHKLAIVHNGIIENYEVLREQLKANGYEFSSETDTEIIAHTIHQALKTSESLLDAVQRSVTQFEGAYGLAVVSLDYPDQIVIARKGSPLVLGLGIGENFIASDQLALLPVTNRFIFIEEGDTGIVERDKISLFDKDGNVVEREVHEFDAEHDSGDKGEFRHYMLKEIYEQPRSIQATLDGRITDTKLSDTIFTEAELDILKEVDRVQIVACGTSYHAGSVARYWLEDIVGLPCQIEVASEFRYRKKVVLGKTLFVTVSQSGETADTLAALRTSKELGFYATLVICNVPGSSLVRESDMCLMTNAGAEIGVASTKAFTTQLVALLLLTLQLGKSNGLSEEKEKEVVRELRMLPSYIEATLLIDKQIQLLAHRFADKHNTLFLGRGVQYPIAMEGALKLKEISYIHAEAYPAGELKHGPLALVDENMPIVAVAPNNELHEKLKSNLEEVRARGGELYVFADKSAGLNPDNDFHVVELPSVGDVVAPIVYTVPLQLLSYYVAEQKGTDIDQPRNLAKSVTVE